MLGTATPDGMYFSRFSIEHVKETYMPKSAMTMSDDESMVRKRVFSGLSKHHRLDL